MTLWNRAGHTSIETSVNAMLQTLGHKCILRHYLYGVEPTKDDKYNNHDGPKWDFVDYVVLLRKEPPATRSGVGGISDPNIVYLDSMIMPQRGDLIIETIEFVERDLLDGQILSLPHREAFVVDEVDYKRMHGGSIVFYTLRVLPFIAGEYIGI